jgi:uncharacterized YccA/Bax inhibitor family protein
MRSSNPVFKTIERDQSYTVAEQATYGGIVAKTFLLFAAAILSGFYAVTSIGAEALVPLLFGAMIIALIAVIVASRSPRLAMPFSFVYALAEGVILGFITVLAEAFAPGAAVTAIIGTGSIFLVMLFLYSSRTIRVTNRFRTIMYASLLGILVFFVFNMLLNVFGVSFFNDFYMSNPAFAVGLSLFLIVFGALMLTLDFDRAESIVEGGADKRYEWMVAVGLMVTIIWIYIEILRLIIILSANRR